MQVFCDSVTHTSSLWASHQSWMHSQSSRTHPVTHCPLAGTRDWPVPVVNRFWELGAEQGIGASLNEAAILALVPFPFVLFFPFPPPIPLPCVPFPFSFYYFPFPVHLFPSLFLFPFPVSSFPLPPFSTFPFPFPFPLSLSLSLSHFPFPFPSPLFPTAVRAGTPAR